MMVTAPTMLIEAKWKGYPEYKESGAEWLGGLPVHWDSVRLKFIASLEMGQSPNSEDYNNVGEGPPFLQGNADFGARHPTPRIFCPTVGKYAAPRDLLLSVRAPVGALNIAD